MESVREHLSQTGQFRETEEVTIADVTEPMCICLTWSVLYGRAERRSLYLFSERNNMVGKTSISFTITSSS